jgi:gas vesicle protein
MDKSSHKSGNYVSHIMSFLAGLLLGGLAGTVAMLLLAPRGGEETRSQIKKQGAKLRHQADESIEEFVTEAGDKAHQFTNGVHQGVSELQQHTQDILGEVRK